jgi:uroporphyrinogen-III synthase
MPDTVLAGCYVISLRPAGQHAALRRAAARHGARLLALSPWTLAARDDAATRADLAAALACTRIVVTSPAAVRAAVALQPLHAAHGQAWFAVGAATARALRRAGVAGVMSPAGGEFAPPDGERRDADASRRMDSEGLLALPGLHGVQATPIGLLTAPGGRGVIERVLQARGARLLRADVYTRSPLAINRRALASLRALQASAWLALSSGDALACTLAQLPDDAAARLRTARVAAASPRLAELADSLGFTGVVVAASAQPRDLVAAMVRGASASMRGIADATGPTA